MNPSKFALRFCSLAGASLFVLSAVGASAQPAAAGKTNAWGATVTDVTPDPAIRLGRLPNGMKYAIMRNSVPKDGASVRLHFDFGSIGEAENERGLAHFLEHMAFNGSKNVPEGEMVKILERQGLKFGPDTNAVTSFDMTMYMLELPKADEQRVDTALMLMREIASNVSFEPAAVDRERGVILGERRSRDTFQLHQIQDLFGFTLPDAPFAKRFPIGDPDVLRTAPPERLRSLYQRYYRPENATFVFVGDVDPAIIEAKMRKTFSDWRGVGPAGAELNPGKVDFKRPSAVDTFIDPAVANQIVIRSFRPFADPADTKADRRKEFAEALAQTMFNRRMQRIVNAPDSVLLYGAMGKDSTDDLALNSDVIAVAKDGSWAQGLQIAEQELRRALQYGFSQSELDLQRAEFQGKLKTAAQQADSRTSAALAGTIIGIIDDDQLLTTPAWDLAFFEQEGGKITLDEVNQALRRLWSGSPPLVHVASKTAISDAEVAAAFANSRKVAVAANKEEAAIDFAYADWGKPGTIASDTRIADLGVRTIRFANNVMLNIKKTDFEPGKVNYMVRMDGGSILFPQDKAGLGIMASSMSAVGATAKHSLEDLKTLTAGKQVNAGFVTTSDAFVSQGTTSADDLDLQMKLSAAYLTDFGFRPEASAQWHNVAPILDKQFGAVPKTLADVRLQYLLAKKDARFGVPPGDQLEQRSFGELKPYLDKAAQSAPIEITIVGDIDEKAAIDSVAKSFGTLPMRQLKPAIDPALRKVAFRSSNDPIVLTHSGDSDQALVGSVWRTDDDADYKTMVGLNVLGEVIDLILTNSVREQLGASYGVSVSSNMSPTYDDFGYLTIDSVVSPGELQTVEKAIADAAKSLRDKPIDADMLARAKNPVLESINKNLRQNAYWAGALDEAQSKPDRLDRIRQREALVKAITPADLQALAKTYLKPENRISVRVLSDKKTAVTAAK